MRQELKKALSALEDAAGQMKKYVTENPQANNEDWFTMAQHSISMSIMRIEDYVLNSTLIDKDIDFADKWLKETMNAKFVGEKIDDDVVEEGSCVMKRLYKLPNGEYVNIWWLNTDGKVTTIII